ncbi:MAG: DNA polymerase III subunit gamma/tau [Oscillospiraceae bacterium]|nr:DNA polymerase III subunit gamma/tau [Oscillospiraceae bacterium]
MALYRKFRPIRFDDMVGQEHITKTLKNQIVADRVGHAYLFNGGRGTGKTSSAKILARAVNCIELQDGEPCNKCEMCTGVLAGTLTDVVEMDAASNNSVEDIRQIREEVNFLPSLAKYRVYIIDEVHMLSTGAFNALLKTLEEPPKHVKFFLATTEPQKLPATILSRCQRFDFKRISEGNIAKRLEIICREDDIKISKEAIHMIAVLAEGGMRDGISILERCIQEEAGNQIEEDTVRELAGIPKMSYINKVARSIILNDVEKLLIAIKEVIDDGKDLDNFLWETIKYVKDILIYKSAKEINIYNSQEKENIKKLSEEITKERLFELIHTLSELANTIKWSSQKTIMLQVGLMKCCQHKAEGRCQMSEKIEKEPVVMQKKAENPKRNDQNDVGAGLVPARLRRIIRKCL